MTQLESQTNPCLTGTSPPSTHSVPCPCLPTIVRKPTGAGTGWKAPKGTQRVRDPGSSYSESALRKEKGLSPGSPLRVGPGWSHSPLYRPVREGSRCELRDRTARNRRVEIPFRIQPETAARAWPVRPAAWKHAEEASSKLQLICQGPTKGREAVSLLEAPRIRSQEGKPSPEPMTVSPCRHTTARSSGGY